MLRLWPKVLRVGVFQREVLVQAGRKGEHIISDIDTSDFGRVAAKAREAAKRYLGQAETANLRVELTLSDAFARVALLPWQPALSDREEVDAYARLCLEAAIPEVNESWNVLTHRAAFGAQGLALAMRAVQLQAIESAFRQCNLHLVQVRPTLSRLIDWARKQSRANVLQVDGRVICLFRMTAGNLDYLEFEIEADSVRAAIARLAARCNTSVSSRSNTIHVWQPGSREESLEGISSAFPGISPLKLPAHEIL